MSGHRQRDDGKSVYPAFVAGQHRQESKNLLIRKDNIMFRKIIAMAILALSLTAVTPTSMNAIEIPFPSCLPCDDPPPNSGGGEN